MMHEHDTCSGAFSQNLKLSLSIVLIFRLGRVHSHKPQVNIFNNVTFRQSSMRFWVINSCEVINFIVSFYFLMSWYPYNSYFVVYYQLLLGLLTVPGYFIHKIGIVRLLSQRIQICFLRRPLLRYFQVHRSFAWKMVGILPRDTESLNVSPLILNTVFFLRL